MFEQASSETQSLFRQAADRFHTVVAEMREAAGLVERELNATREEMRRGIFELPKETAESTAEMRRVVVEQIDALAELNRIVARHGRGVDAVQPQRAPPREDAFGFGNGAPRPPSFRAEIAAPRSAPSRRPEPPRPAVSDAGWLQDVLARASQDLPEEDGYERASEEQGSSLDAIPIDIARMVDHDAASDLWEQRQRGEPVTPGRDLYTAQGQATFEEIRRKYRVDRDFRQTVDRYLSEFERLLDEVAADDPNGGAVTHSYLTSETGKVYTMLAHAAGRLE
jgi:hypothetical protein